MKESGTFHKIANSYAGDSQVCDNTSGDALDMNQCFTAFVVLLIGGGMGLLLLM